MLSNALWPPDLVERTPDQSVMHCWGQRSCRGQPGSSRGQIAEKCCMATKFGRKNPWSKCNSLLGQRSCRGQPEVKFFRNALWPPNLAERTPDQSVMHRWVKGHAGVSCGQPECSCLEMRKTVKCSQCYRALCSCRCSSVSKQYDSEQWKIW